MKLYKTTIVIWSESDPSQAPFELEDLARDATSGSSICTKMDTVQVDESERDEDWDGNEFFTDTEDENAK